MAIIFDGRRLAEEKTKELVRDFGVIRDVGKRPKMVAILVGDNPESELYLKLKEKKARQLGIDFEFRRFTAENPQDIINFIQEKNADFTVQGIMVELPLPKELRIMNYELRVKNAINVKKDIDCLTKENLKLLEEGKPRFVPPTVKAVGEILREALRVLGDLGGLGKKEIVVVGSEGVVGKGIISYLKTGSRFRDIGEIRGVDQETKDLILVTKKADILISATGVGHLIKKEMVKDGAIVIDVGIEKKGKSEVVGDVDFEQVKQVASFITPVPGGVGPVTIVSLMENLLQSVYH